jgi:hypothetical protein
MPYACSVTPSRLSCESSRLIITRRTLVKIIPTRTRVRDQTGQVAVFVEHYTVGAGAAAAVDLAGAQDREFVVRPRDEEGEALVVVVSVRKEEEG